MVYFIELERKKSFGKFIKDKINFKNISELKTIIWA